MEIKQPASITVYQDLGEPLSVFEGRINKQLEEVHKMNASGDPIIITERNKSQAACTIMPFIKPNYKTSPPPLEQIEFTTDPKRFRRGDLTYNTGLKTQFWQNDVLYYAGTRRRKPAETAAAAVSKKVKKKKNSRRAR